MSDVRPRPPMKLMPVYAAPADPPSWSWSFTPTAPGQEPAVWGWVPEGSEVRFSDAHGADLLFMPGRMSGVFAHELRYMAERLEAVPLDGISGVVPPR